MKHNIKKNGKQTKEVGYHLEQSQSQEKIEVHWRQLLHNLKHHVPAMEEQQHAQYNGRINNRIKPTSIIAKENDLGHSQ